MPKRWDSWGEKEKEEQAHTKLAERIYAGTCQRDVWQNLNPEEAAKVAKALAWLVQCKYPDDVNPMAESD